MTRVKRHSPTGAGAPSETVLEALLQQEGQAVFILDPETREPRWLNRTIEHLLGYQPAEKTLSLIQCSDWVHPEDAEEFQLLYQQLLGGNAAAMELRARNGRGHWHWIQVGGSSVTTTDGRQIVIGFIRDTQPYHDAEKIAREEAGKKQIGTLAEGLAHEFNNLLTPIRGFIELALDGLRPEDPIADGLRTALDQVERCAQLVSQIQLCGQRSFVRPQRIQPERVLPSLARIALSSYRGTGKRYQLKLEWRPRLPPLVADRIQFQEAIIQLLKNAIEAMPEGGTITIRAEPVRVAAGPTRARAVSLENKEAFMRIDIIDTGCGMTAEVLEHAMDPFFTTHSRAGKRGMGLSMVRGMAEQNGGWVELESKPGKGTRATIYLPLDEAARLAVVEEPLPDEDGTLRVLPAAPVGRALVGDDDELVRELVARTFESEGWAVKTVDGFDKVLRLIDENCLDFDVAVLDLTMAGGTIGEVMAQLRQVAPQMPVIIVSGFGYDDMVAQLTREGNGRVSYMSKPFSPKELLQRVDELFAMQAAEEAQR